MGPTTLIRSVMTPFPHAVDIDAPLSEAQDLMIQHRIRHLPVREYSELVGMMTDRDLSLALGRLGQRDRDAGRPRVRDVCVRDIYTVDMTASLHDVVAEMARRRLDAALITKEGRLAGIFTATDACRQLAALLAEPTDDAAA